MGSFLSLLIIFINLNFFIKIIFISCIFYLLIFVFVKVRYIKKYEFEMNTFDNTIKNKNINFKDFYAKLLNNNTINIGLSVIFISGFQEFIKLHRHGISDINAIMKIVERVMINVILNEICGLVISLHNLFVISTVFLYAGIMLTIFSTASFLQQVHMFVHNHLSFSVLIFAANEILAPLFFGLLIAFIIKIIYYKYSLVIYKIYNRYFTFVNEFIVLLFHKFYS